MRKDRQWTAGPPRTRARRVGGRHHIATVGPYKRSSIVSRAVTDLLNAGYRGKYLKNQELRVRC